MRTLARSNEGRRMASTGPPLRALLRKEGPVCVHNPRVAVYETLVISIRLMSTNSFPTAKPVSAIDPTGCKMRQRLPREQGAITAFSPAIVAPWRFHKRVRKEKRCP